MTGVAGGVRERHSLGASVDGASGGGGKGHRAGGEKRMKKRPRPDRLGPTPVPTSYSPTVPTDWPTYSPTSLEGAPSKALRMIEREREKRRKREEEERAKAEGGRPGPRAGSSAPSLAPSPALAGEGSDGTIAASPSAPPSGAPSRSPSGTPSGRPSAEPSGAPAARPSAAPVPTTRPPTAPPTSGGCSSLNGSRCKKSHSCVLVRSGDGEEETHECLPRPTAGPTTAPSAVPTAVPTADPTAAPTAGRPATPDGSVRVGLTMDAPSIVVPTAPTPPPDGSSKVTLTLDPDEAKARGPSEFSLTTWGLEGADVAAKAGRGNPGGRHGGRPKSERNGSGFSLAAGSLGGSGGDTTSSGDGEGDGEKNKAADGASKVNLSFSAAAGDAAVAESDPGKKVSLSFSLPSDDSPVPTAGPSGEPTYLLFPTYGPSSAPRKKSKKDKKDKDKDKEEEEEEEEVDTDSPTSWPTTYLPTYLPTSPIGDALDPRKRFDPLSSGDVSPEDREGAGTDHRGKHPTDLSSLYERRACPTSPRARASPRGVGGGAIPVERTVERTVEFAYALQSAGSGEDAAETVQLHLLEDVALGLLGCHARVSSARSAGGGGGATSWAEEVWYERDASVASMREFFCVTVRLTSSNLTRVLTEN